MRTAALAAVGAAALSIALGAVALAATPIPGTLGLRLTPAPVRLDDGDRTITAINLSGGLPLSVALTVSDGYTVAPMAFDLAPDAEQVVSILTVDPDRDGTISALATNGAATTGAVSSAINLTTGLRHKTQLERLTAALGPLVPLGAALVLVSFLIGLWAVRRKVQA